MTLVLGDRFNLALIEWFRPRSAQHVQVYAWAKGPFREHFREMGLQVLSVVETLTTAAQKQ